MEDFSLIEKVGEVMSRNGILPYPKRGLWATDSHIILLIGEEGKQVERTFGKCRREIVMSMLGIGGKWTNSYDSQIIFDLGHWFEARWQGYFKEAGIWRGSNVKWFDAAHNLSGEFDAVVEIDGETILVEFKSGTGGFKQREVIKDGHISDDYIMQVGLYLWHGQDIFLNGARLVYWVGSNQKIQIREFEIDRDDDWNLYVDGSRTRLNVMSQLESFKTTMDYVNKKIIPARGYYKEWSQELFEALVHEGLAWETTKKRSDWRCDYCRHEAYCSAIDAGEVSLEDYEKQFGKKEDGE